MSTGTTTMIPIDKLGEQPQKPLETYFVVKIKLAQAAYYGKVWQSVQQLVVTTRVSMGSDQEAISSINRTRPISKNQAVQLGLSTNLIDLTPTIMDKVSIALEFRLDTQNRLAMLMDMINSNDSPFTSVISLAPGAMATAKAISKISKSVITTFLDSGKTPILELNCDINIGQGEAKNRYYVFLASHDANHPLPKLLPNSNDLKITDSALLYKEQPIENLSYIVLEVSTYDWRTAQLGHNQAWYKKLMDAQQIFEGFKYKPTATKTERQNAYEQCCKHIQDASALLFNDPLYLNSNASKIIENAYAKAYAAIFPQRRTLGAAEPSKLPAEVSELTGAQNYDDLMRKMQFYKETEKKAQLRLTELVS
jgi:hypothetical protein